MNSFYGKWLVLYFYPKNNTSGCTREAVDFTAHLSQFQEMGAEVVESAAIRPQVTRSSLPSTALKVGLLSDQDHKVTEAYGAWALKKMYGKEGWGTIRSTFLIDPEGK